VSFGRRTVIIRSGIQRSGPATPPPEREPEPPAPEPEPAALAAAPAPESPALAAAPEPESSALAAAPEPESSALAAAPEPEPEPASNGARDGAPVPTPPPAVPTRIHAPTADGSGAPPDSGALARVIPGILIVMAIGIALLVAGIVGDNTPATTDDIDPPSLREPAREPDTPGPLPTPPAPRSDAPADMN